MKKVFESGFATWCGVDDHHRRRQQRCCSQSFLFPGSLGFPATACSRVCSFDLVVKSIMTATKLLYLLTAAKLLDLLKLIR